MGVIQDSEYVLYKAVAEKIVKGLSKPLSVLDARILVEFAQFEKQKNLFVNSDTYLALGENTNNLKRVEKTLMSTIAVQDRLFKIVERNKQRLGFIDGKLDAVGIYNYSVEKKALANAVSAGEKDISEQSLNLNPLENNGVTLKFFAGEILAFRDDSLDFGLEENQEILLNGSQAFFHEVVSTFPYAVATILDKMFMNSAVKNKILKECVLYVASKFKTQTIAESNKDLGGLLCRCGDISSLAKYASELRNYFNVVAKQTLISIAPEMEREIHKTLKCNELSDYLPVSRFSYVDESLLNDEETAEEGSFTQEEFLDALLNDDDILSELEEMDDDEEESKDLQSVGQDESQDNAGGGDIDALLNELEAIFEEEAKGDSDNDDKVGL